MRNGKRIGYNDCYIDFPRNIFAHFANKRRDCKMERNYICRFFTQNHFTQIPPDFRSKNPANQILRPAVHCKVVNERESTVHVVAGIIIAFFKKQMSSLMLWKTVEHFNFRIRILNTHRFSKNFCSGNMSRSRIQI